MPKVHLGRQKAVAVIAVASVVLAAPCPAAPEPPVVAALSTLWEFHCPPAGFVGVLEALGGNPAGLAVVGAMAADEEDRVLPRIDLSARPLREVVDAVARATGRQWEFRDGVLTLWGGPECACLGGMAQERLVWYRSLAALTRDLTPAQQAVVDAGGVLAVSVMSPRQVAAVAKLEAQVLGGTGEEATLADAPLLGIRLLFDPVLLVDSRDRAAVARLAFYGGLHANVDESLKVVPTGGGGGASGDAPRQPAARRLGAIVDVLRQGGMPGLYCDHRYADTRVVWCGEWPPSATALDRVAKACGLSVRRVADVVVVAPAPRKRSRGPLTDEERTVRGALGTLLGKQAARMATESARGWAWPFAVPVPGSQPVRIAEADLAPPKWMDLYDAVRGSRGLAGSLCPLGQVAAIRVEPQMSFEFRRYRQVTANAEWRNELVSIHRFHF